MDMVQAVVTRQPTAALPLRGADHQPRRELQQTVRRRVVTLAEALAELGHRRDEVAQRLRLNARTLRHWTAACRRGNEPAAVVGRPPALADADQQQAVFSWLQATGPGVGLPALRRCFPALARAELADMLRWYRRLWRAQHPRLLHVLHWQRPGAVWAMDFAEPSAAIAGAAPYLLAVRDLASGQQLLWLPTPAPTAEVTRAALTALFLVHGAPLVLKTDNGSAFIADDLMRLLTQWQVLPLFSPPHTPSYNGSIEASIGALKRRTERQAEQAGHPEMWTSENVEAARQEANATPRRKRLHGQIPTAVWAARVPLTATEREAFLATVARGRVEARNELGLPPSDVLARVQQAKVDRNAIRRALVAHGFLLFRRRRIPVPIKRLKTAKTG